MKSRKGQLVCQHLENISRKALEQYQNVIKEFVKGRHGIYALFSGGNLYYVGLASNLRNRLKIHLRGRHAKNWDSFSVYLTIKDSHLHELESLVLRISSPRGNRQYGKFIESQDLKPFFRRKVSRVLKNELDDIFGEYDNKKDENKTKKDIKKIKGRKPILAPYVKKYFNKRFEIRFRYKGTLYKATVRKDGTIYFKGKLYNSPSMAGQAVINRACNGWEAWKYERAPGDWVKLKELRKR